MSAKIELPNLYLTSAISIYLLFIFNIYYLDLLADTIHYLAKLYLNMDSQRYPEE